MYLLLLSQLIAAFFVLAFDFTLIDLVGATSCYKTLHDEYMSIFAFSGRSNRIGQSIERFSVVALTTKLACGLK